MYDPYQSSATTGATSGSLIRMVVRLGIAKNEVSARTVLAVVAIICFLITGYIIYQNTRNVDSPVTQQQIDNALKNMSKSQR